MNVWTTVPFYVEPILIEMEGARYVGPILTATLVELVSGRRGGDGSISNAEDGGSSGNSGGGGSGGVIGDGSSGDRGSNGVGRNGRRDRGVD